MCPVLTVDDAGGGMTGACASGLVSRRDEVSLARLLSPFIEDASLAKLTVSDTKGESCSDDVSEAVVLGSESASAKITCTGFLIIRRSNERDFEKLCNILRMHLVPNSNGNT